MNQSAVSDFNTSIFYAFHLQLNNPFTKIFTVVFWRETKFVIISRKYTKRIAIRFDSHATSQAPAYWTLWHHKEYVTFDGFKIFVVTLPSYRSRKIMSLVVLSFGLGSFAVFALNGVVPRSRATSCLLLIGNELRRQRRTIMQLPTNHQNFVRSRNG